MPDVQQPTSPIGVSDATKEDDVAAIDNLRQIYEAMCEELGKVIIGQHEVIEKLLICIFARGPARQVRRAPGCAKWAAR